MSTRPHVSFAAPGRAIRRWPARLRERIADRAGPLTLLALPWLLLAADPNWIAAMLYHDSWMYFGYFLDLPGHLSGFAEFYYGTRLSVILPGWAAHALLPPVAANHALHLAVYYAGVFAAYGTLRELAGPRAALLTAIGLGGHPFYLMAVGWDYADGFGIAYSLLATWLLVRAGREDGWRWNCFLAGAAAAALVVANIAYAVLVPPMAIVAWAANRAGRRHPLVPGLVAFAIGAGALFGILTAVFAGFTGEWWLFGPSLRFARIYGAMPNPFRAASWDWLARAGWLWLPALAVAVSSVALMRWAARRRWRSPRSFPAAALQLQAVAVAAVFAASQFRPQGVGLQLWYYASLMIPSAALALGSVLGPAVDRLDGRRFAWLAALAVVGAVRIPMFTAPARWSDHVPVPLAVELALGLAGCVALVVAARSARVATAAAVTGFVLLGAGQLLAAVSFRVEDSMPIHQPDGWRIRAYDRQRTDVVRAAAEVVAAARRADPAGGVYFWYHVGEPHGVFFENLACTYNGALRLVNSEFPSVQGVGVSDPLPPDRRVAILSQTEDAADRARAALAPLGRSARVLEERRVRAGRIEFVLTMIEVESGGSD